jgi:hypothetical protein
LPAVAAVAAVMVVTAVMVGTAVVAVVGGGGGDGRDGAGDSTGGGVACFSWILIMRSSLYWITILSWLYMTNYLHKYVVFFYNGLDESIFWKPAILSSYFMSRWFSNFLMPSRWKNIAEVFACMLLWNHWLVLKKS